MAMMTTETAAGAPTRTRRPRRADGTAATRSRRPQLGGDALVATLAEQVDLLIKENRDLKRALARAEKAQGGGGLGQAAKTLSGLQRRLSRELDATTSRRRGAATGPSPAPRPRRKVTDPEVLERRRQA